ncbi:MAG: TonB-dependent receptor [Paludibacteraceae bacterium]|nr:TonB-dependent receptor [Paludibacteraceae bacterium]
MKLNFRVFRTMMLSVLLLSGMTAEARVISGTVKDPTGETIISASVVVKGTTIGTVTDFDGNYTIDVPDDAKVLVFSYIGMKTQELNITGDVMNVVLSENSEVLEEVVVTGYGTTKKRDLVTAVSSVSADQIKDVPVASAAEALQGKLAGVSVTTAEGSPDADVKIRVRGGTSLTQSNDPLYIVDGMPVSSISDIAPTDIASMDVLKDAAATAIYGAQGANGVIIITTKDANTDSEDKMVFHFDYAGYVGWKWLAKRPRLLSNTDFIMTQMENAYLWRGGVNDANFYDFFPSQYAGDFATLIADAETFERTDWLDKTFGRTGFDSNHSISVSGGNKNATFNLNYTRTDNTAIMQASDYHRNNLSLKAKFKPIKNMTIAFNTRYSDTNVNGSGSNTTKDEGSKTASESRLRNAVVYTPIHLEKQAVSEEDPEDRFGSLYNPLEVIHDNYKNKKEVRFNVNGYISYKFLKHFTWKSEIGYDYKSVNTNRFYGAKTAYTAQVLCPGKSAGIVLKEFNSKFRQTNTFNWDQKFANAHNVSLLLGEEILINKGWDATQTFMGFDKSMEPERVFQLLGSAESSISTNYIDPNDNMLSFFARANYDYKSRYYVSLTFRADGSSRFTKGNQWGFFPSAAVAWNIAEESFMENAQSWMSQLKLRFSYGTAGNNQVNLGYLYPDFVTSQPGTPWISGITNVSWIAGGSKKIAANPNLKWETTITRNLGLDYGFFNQRLSGSLDLYLNTTKDLILLYNLSQSYSAQYRNIGSTENRGIEFSVNGIILDHHAKDLHYNLSVSANIAANKTIVKDLGGLESLPAPTGLFSGTLPEFNAFPGQAIGNIYGFKTDGIYLASQDFEDYSGVNWQLKDNAVQPHADQGKAYPGMVKLADVSGANGTPDGKIDANDLVILGNALPKCSGGFSINFNIGGEKWGQIDLGANFTYAIGNKVLNLNKMDWTTIGTSDNKTSWRNMLFDVAFQNRYSMFDATGAYLPDVISARPEIGYDFDLMAKELDAINANKTRSPYSKGYLITDEFVEDGSFLRLNQLTLGYSLAEKWISKAYITKCRIYVQASNLFCATKYSGFDPEVDVLGSKNPLQPGVDYSAYPKSRGFNVGVNLSF